MRSGHQIAFLGMYDFPALRQAQNDWWAGLARHFKDSGFTNIPGELNRSTADPYDLWLSADLFFAQTCGYPLTHRLAAKVQLVGTPCYAAPGCEGALYRSLFVVASDFSPDNLADALPARIAINGKDSYSGWRALAGAVDKLQMDGAPFTETIVSGAHAKSIDLVREGAVDMAAIDCVTHALIGDVEPERLIGTRVLEQSAPAPGLPYITRPGMTEQQVTLLIKATRNAFKDPELAETRKTLRLSGFDTVPLQAYVQSMT